MALDVPEGEFLLVTLFVCTPIDAGASLDKARLRMLGTLGGGAIGLFATVLVLDKAWLFLPLQALVIGVAMFFSRTTTAPYAFILGAITFIMVLPLYPSTPAANIEIALWRTGLTTLGVLLASAAQLLFWPDDPEELLLDTLVRRARDTETLLARVPGLRPGDHLSAAEEGMGLPGVSAQLDLLKSAEVRSRWLRQRHAEQIALITRVQLLVTAAPRLVRLAVMGPLPAWALPRIERARRACQELADALPARHPGSRTGAAASSPAPDATASSTFDLEVAAALDELELMLSLLPDTTAFLDASRAAPAAAAVGLAEQRLLTPACTPHNVEAIRFALKVALATTICGILLEAMDQPGWSTALITCPLTAQSFVAAGLRRAVLRITGALAGSAIALLIIIAAMPAMDTLASYLVVAGLAFGTAAWVVTGSSRTSYVGLQMAIVMALTIVEARAPTTDLSPAADRIMGVLIGIVVMGAVDVMLWPVFGDTALRRMLADALRQMADLHQVAASGDRAGMRQRALGIYRTLGDALAMHDDLAFEPGGGDAASVHGALPRVTSGCERLFLDLINLGRHRPATIVPALAAEVARLDADTAAAIGSLAERLTTGAGETILHEARLAALRGDETLRGLVRLYEVVFAALAALDHDLGVLERAVSPLRGTTGRAFPPSSRPRTPAPQPS